jgi:tetratricopeptide (TPR) repeat protein
MFLADHGLRLNEAVAQARAIYEKQPGNIRAADALSWALSKTGRHEEALGYSREATRLGSADPLLLFRAGMINFASGNRAAARDMLSRALDANPRFSVLHADEAESALAELNATVERGR